MKTLEELRKRQAEIAERLKTLHTEIGEGEGTDEQRAEWDALDTEHRDNEAKIAPLAEQEQRDARVKASRAKWGTVQAGTVKADPFDVNLRTADDRTLVSRARQVLTDDKEGTAHLRDEQRANVERVLQTRNGDTNGADVARLLIATENEHYRSAFPKLISGRPDYSTEESRAIQEVSLAARAMNIGTPAAGGYAVPVLLDPTIIWTDQGSPNDILALARTERITNDRWRGLSATGMTWKFDVEGAKSTASGPVLTKPEVPTYRADGFIDYTIEVEMDWQSFASDMSTAMESGYRELLASTLTNGTGVNQPTGIVTAIGAGQQVQVATSATIAAADIYKLWAALPMRWRRRSTVAWMADTSIEQVIRQFGTTDPNFTVNLNAEFVNPLFRREFIENDFMADMPTGISTALLLLLGDWKQYLIAQRMGMTVERLQMLFDPTTGEPTGKRGMVGYARVGADLLVDDAFRALINK